MRTSIPSLGGPPRSLRSSPIPASEQQARPSPLDDDSSVGFGMRWKNAALDVEWLPRERDEPYAFPIVCGCFMAMRREVFEQTGGFDPGLILSGGGEMELCFRLWALGYECRIAPRTRVAHLFRPRFPYAVDPAAVLHNML
jgi:polypeptide N-acetylgalactosaminyltransferase